MPALLLASLLLIGADPKTSAPTINGAWVLSEQWTGYMGIALVFKDDDFEYWFYSDVKGPDDPVYPIRGKVRYYGDYIRLLIEDDKRLYSTKWRLVVHQGEICLLSDEHLQEYQRSKKFPSDRLLHKLADFDRENPQMNRPEARP
jgi:hypothetical protein